MLILTFILFCSPHAAEDRVLAVVNDQIITQSSVLARTKLLEQRNGLTNITEQQRLGLAKRTLANMIDEELQRQYAQTENVDVTREEIKAAATRIAAKDPAFAQLLANAPQVVNEQLAAEIRWDKVINQVIRPTIQVGTGEVDTMIGNLAKSRHVLEREISQIFIGVDDTSAEADAKAKIESIRDRVKNKADFATLAREFSEDPSAANGGNMGWFGSGDLNPQLEEALATMKTGDVSNIIRTPLGFHLVRLENTRTTKPISTDPITQLRVIWVAMPVPADKDLTDEHKQLADVMATKTKQADVTAALADTAFMGTWTASKDMGWVATDDLRSALQQAVANTKVGTWSAPLTMDGELGSLFVAERREAVSPDLAGYRERVQNHLMTNRTELATRQLMRQLRQKAFVDIRW